MKLYLTIFFALVFSLPLLAQEDYDPNEKPPFVRAAIIAGMNVSQVDGDGIAGFRKFGANGGAAAYVNIHKGFNASFEILYSMRGAKRGRNQDSRLESITLDYIEVPFMLHYNDRDKAIFGAGVSWNTLVRSGAKGLTPSEEISAKRASLDFVGGVTFLIKKRYGINLRYSYSLTSIGNYTSTLSTLEGGKLRNNVVGVRFMYFLN